MSGLALLTGLFYTFCLMFEFWGGRFDLKFC
jgi:hypothetical protein